MQQQYGKLVTKHVLIMNLITVYINKQTNNIAKIGVVNENTCVENRTVVCGNQWKMRWTNFSYETSEIVTSNKENCLYNNPVILNGFYGKKTYYIYISNKISITWIVWLQNFVYIDKKMELAMSKFSLTFYPFALISPSSKDGKKKL